MVDRTVAALALFLIFAGCAGPVSPNPSPSALSPTQAPTTRASSASPASASPVPSSTSEASSSPSASPQASPSFDPATSANVTNPWFPLTPGTRLTYHGTKDGEPAVDVVTVTDRTRLINGVMCRVISDRLTLSGRLAERTTDYYTQDSAGNVWYFGEDTAEFDAAGRVTSREGTWHAGVDGAQAGLFMQATPTIGASFVQELYVGHAEDHFEVLSLSARVTVPFGSFTDVLRTKEWTPLEPDVIDNKYYVRNIGEVREVSRSGAREELRLVSVSHS